MKKIELAYLAGFLDGEGCFTLVKTYRQDVRFDYWGNIQCGMANTPQNREILQWLKNLFGGYYKEFPQTEKRKLRNQKPVVFWRIVSQSSAKCAKQLLPFLRVKRRQAEIIIAFAKLQEKHRRKRGLKFTKAEIEKRENLLQEIRKLNKKGL